MLRSSSLLLVLFVSVSVPFASAEEPALKAAWSVTEGLKAPESAHIHARSGKLFLSQIGEGGGKAKDGDGWVSMLDINGKMLKNKWVTGLDAPKGVRSHGDTLYVSDIDQIVVIDIPEAKIRRRVKIADAKFLNDLATDTKGAVYVSDMAASRVYKYSPSDDPSREGDVSVFVEGEMLEHPNGLLVDGEHLVIGGWGSGFDASDFSTKTLGRLQKVHLQTKQVTPITKEPTGHLDGIEADGKGGYTVTDWVNGKLFHIDATGSTKLLMSFPKGAADHAYLPSKRWVILPEMLEGKLTAYQLP